MWLYTICIYIWVCIDFLCSSLCAFLPMTSVFLCVSIFSWSLSMLNQCPAFCAFVLTCLFFSVAMVCVCMCFLHYYVHFEKSLHLPDFALFSLSVLLCRFILFVSFLTSIRFRTSVCSFFLGDIILQFCCAIVFEISCFTDNKNLMLYTIDAFSTCNKKAIRLYIWNTWNLFPLYK